MEFPRQRSLPGFARFTRSRVSAKCHNKTLSQRSSVLFFRRPRPWLREESPGLPFEQILELVALDPAEPIRESRRRPRLDSNAAPTVVSL